MKKVADVLAGAPLRDTLVAQTDSRGRPRVQTVNKLPSVTVQSDRQRTEIPWLLQQYGIQGVQVGLRDAEAQYADVSAFTDLSDALRQAMSAEVAFRALPPKVRALFDNDVSVWLDAAHDPAKQADVDAALAILNPPPVPPAAPAGSGGTPAAPASVPDPAPSS